ncbi:MAG: transposase [Anaeromyxobacter sp.]
MKKDEKTAEKTEAAKAAAAPENVRGRPGRRSAEDRRRAVLELLGGKATVDQVAMRFGVLPETVEGWRADALAGIDAALRQGTGKSARETELEAELEVMRETALNATVQVTLLQKAMGIKPRPSRPARSRK